MFGLAVIFGSFVGIAMGLAGGYAACQAGLPCISDLTK